MFHQNAQHTGLSRFQGPTVPALSWKYQTGGEVLSPPAISRGRIYFGSTDGNLYALNRQGKLLWTFKTGFPIRTTPAIGEDGTTYLGTDAINALGRLEGILFAINPSGTLRWNLTIPNTGEGIESLSSPTIAPDGTIYVSDVGFRIIAVNPDGTIKWEYATHGEVVAPPALATDGTIYVAIDDPDAAGVCTNKCLLALNPDGTPKWGALFLTPGFSSPAVGPDGTVYIDSWAVNPDGAVRWRNPGKFQSPSIGGDGTIYGTIEGGLSALNPNGTLEWTFPTEKSGGICTPTGCSYLNVALSAAAIDSNQVIYFGKAIATIPSGGLGDGTGTLSAVFPDGTLEWSFRIGLGSGSGICEPGFCGQGLSDPAIGADGTIYIGSTDGNLYAVGDAQNLNL